MSDRVASMDRACEDAKQTARPIAAFVRALADSGMSEKLANEIALLYARKILKVQG